MSRLVFVLISVLTGFGDLVAQGNPFDDGLLPAVRNAAGMIPGAPPTAVNALKVAYFPPPPSYVIEGYEDEFVDAVHTMFQIRYPDGWIMVDISGDREMLGKEGFSEEAFRESVDGLIGARLIITTHEHHDHVWRLTNGPNTELYAPKTMLTSEQIHTLMTAPNRPEVGLTKEQAAKFLTVGYDRFLPLAPGVVLIKAPGHTPGGQMVYVRRDDGQEILLSGDVAWQRAGIDQGLQKPEGVSIRLGEDREAIAHQLEWLRAVAGEGVAVVVFHDLALLNKQIEQGILGDGIELY
jgi:glyoxylase-like metal-dependent hydrolase (beta-lactamase superfamily II)